MQRALSVPELTAPPLKPQDAATKISPSDLHSKTTAPNQVKTHEKNELSKSTAPLKIETQISDTLQKKESPILGSHQRAQPTAVTQPAGVTKGPESHTQAIPAPGQKIDHTSKSVPKQSRVIPETQQESGNVFGVKIGPDASKTTESMTGKMRGFGSSIFSSASTLISSAVPEDSRTTPPGSRKLSAPGLVSPKMSVVHKISPNSTPTVSPKMSPAREPKTLAQTSQQEKETEESHQSKEDKAPSQMSKAVTDQATCPLCKVELNIGSKDPLNFNTCTECKSTVCNQCGFNPMPIGEVSELICYIGIIMYNALY